MALVSFIGEHPLARNSDGMLVSRIATAFPRRGVIVTLAGIHATQRVAYIDSLNERRAADGKPPLTDDEQMAEWDYSVDLIIDDDDSILIRPDPENMALAFEADDMLQGMPQFARPDMSMSKRKIRFLHVLDKKVRHAIQRRGEAWRIHPLPTSPEEMAKMIVTSRIGIGGKPIYYYNATTGTRWLTYQEFANLGRLDEDELRRHLTEIAQYSALYTSRGRREVDFFGVKTGFTSEDLVNCNFPAIQSGHVRAAWEWLHRKFESAVPDVLRLDNVDVSEWRNAMYCALIDLRGDVVSEEALLGLGSEWFMQVEWLPGARFEEGELIFDSVFDEQRSANEPAASVQLEDTVRGLICNLIQDYGDIEYLNIGRVTGSLGAKKLSPGRRDVFVVQVKPRESVHEELQIVRMQKWDVRERLAQGKHLLQAMVESQEYTEYILDRRLACKQLWMNLSPRAVARQLAERFTWPHRRDEIIIRSTYFQRDYVKGISSNKLHTGKLANEKYAVELARLLGQAAAPNLIVGRCDIDGRLIFDDGDEVVMEDGQGMPTDIFVADHTGTFGNYRGSLRDLAPHYGIAVNRRLQFIADPRSFVQAYLDSFVERFEQIQAEYRLRERAFDNLFKHRVCDEGGNLACRWKYILKRLAPASARELADAIRSGIAV